MFSPDLPFSEVVRVQTIQGRPVKVVRLSGVPKVYFSCIVQYLYSDCFYCHQHSLNFYVHLMVYADFFLLPRMAKVCQKKVAQFINVHNALSVLLIANSYNCQYLSTEAIRFICRNESLILRSKEWKKLVKLSFEHHFDTLSCLSAQILDF